MFVIIKFKLKHLNEMYLYKHFIHIYLYMYVQCAMWRKKKEICITWINCKICMKPFVYNIKINYFNIKN